MDATTYSHTTNINGGAQAAEAVDLETLSDSSLDSLSAIDNLADRFTAKGQRILDKSSSPEDRQNLFTSIHAFITGHPKLIGFILLNLLITGIPVTVFTLFALSVGVSSVVTGLVITLCGAGLFTLVCVGIAFLFLVPAICFTTVIACSIFLWLLAGLYLFRWIRRIRQYFWGQAATESESLGAKVGGWPDEFREIVEADRKIQEKNGIPGGPSIGNP